MARRPCALAARAGGSEPSRTQARFMARPGVSTRRRGCHRPRPATSRRCRRRADHGRDHAARQHGDEGLSEESEGHDESLSPAVGSTPATSVSAIPIGTSKSRTAPRTSSSPAARTFPRWKSRRCCTATPTSWRPRWWRSPDEKWGEVPHAFVTPRAGAEERLTEAAVIAWCRANMAHFKVPQHVSFVQLPKTSTGKIQKYALRQRIAEELRK